MLQLFNQFAVFTKTLGSNTAGKWEKCAAIHAADLRHLIEDFPDVRDDVRVSVGSCRVLRHTGLRTCYCCVATQA